MSQYLAHILPDTDLHDGDQLIPLGDPDFYDMVLESLITWVEAVHPPVLLEHERNGTVLGKVTRCFGDEGGIYCQFDVPDNVALDIDAGAYRFVSPTVAWSFTADTGEVWPAALLELSLVSVPRHYLRQRDLTELNSAYSQLAAGWTSDEGYYSLDLTGEAAALFVISQHLKALCK